MHISALFHCIASWAGALGAFFGLIGALLMATNVWLTQKQAVEAVFLSLGDGNQSVMVNDPKVQGLLAQSLRTKIGIILLMIGFALQVWGSWPK